MELPTIPPATPNLVLRRGRQIGYLIVAIMSYNTATNNAWSLSFANAVTSTIAIEYAVGPVSISLTPLA